MGQKRRFLAPVLSAGAPPPGDVCGYVVAVTDPCREAHGLVNAG